MTGDGAGGGARSLPLILARELAANLSTPMFLIDAEGTLAYCNDAAELMLGRSFGELGVAKLGIRLQRVEDPPVDIVNGVLFHYAPNFETNISNFMPNSASLKRNFDASL